MTNGPFTVEEKKGAKPTIAAPGMIITAEKDRRASIGIDAICAQLNRAYEAGKLEGKKQTDEEETKLSERYKMQRDGWKLIAEALLAVGMGYDMRGFDDNPPEEIIKDLLGTTEIVHGTDENGKPISKTITTPPRNDAAILEALRDSLVGRAWRVAGSQGKGGCDYPLCPNRAAGRKPTGYVDTPLVNNAKLHVCASNRAKAETELGDTFTEVNECHRWALWVSHRAIAGRIEVKR